MHCIENTHQANTVFNNKIDRCHYSALLKVNLQKSSIKIKRKLTDRDNKQASSQIQYHSNTKKKANHDGWKCTAFPSISNKIHHPNKKNFLFYILPKQQNRELHSQFICRVLHLNDSKANGLKQLV